MKSSPDKEENKDHHRTDEQVNVCLECKEINTMKTLKRKILRLSAQATVTHLKKFVSLKVFDTTDRYRDVSCILLVFFRYSGSVMSCLLRSTVL